MFNRIVLLVSSLCLISASSAPSAWAQPADFPQEILVVTTATFVDVGFPSSRNNSFKVTFLPTNPTGEGSFTFRRCTISGVPSDEAVRLGNCQWTEFVDDGHKLLLFTLNWQDASDLGTGAVWGQSCLLNQLGEGVWVRFFTEDGTQESIVGSASGHLTYPGGGGGGGGNGGGGDDGGGDDGGGNDGPFAQFEGTWSLWTQITRG